MENKKVVTIIAIFILLICGNLYAANHYILDGGTGDGSAWNNALDTLPATLVRGDTYYIGDGTYAGYTFDDATSGSTYIYIRKATVAAHGSDTGWSNDYGDGVATFTGQVNISTNYIDIDGMVGAGAGTTPYGFHFHPTTCTGAGKVIQINQGNYISIKHVDLENCGYSNALRQDVLHILGTSHITVAHNWLHNANRALLGSFNATYLTVEYNWFTERYSYDNYGIHGEAISTNGSTTDANHIYRYNVFRNIEGSAVIMIKDSVQAGFQIYGNVFYNDADHILDGYNFSESPEPSLANFDVTNGPISDGSGEDRANNALVYNNTFANTQAAGNGPTGIDFNNSTGDVCYNNLFSGGEYAGVVACDTVASNTTNGATSLFTDYANHDYTLASAVAGTALNSPYNMDMRGYIRGDDGTFDQGAYEYDDTPAEDTDTPDLSSAVIGTTGAVLTITLDEDVAVNNASGFTLDCDGGTGEGLSFVSESDGVLTYNITGRAIDGTAPDKETCTLDYATVSNGIEDAAGNDLESIGDPIPVTNNSTWSPTEVSYTVTPSTAYGCAISPGTAVSVTTGQTTQFTCSATDNNYQCTTWTGTCGGTGTTTLTTSAITADCTVIQPCRQIAASCTISAGAKATLGSGAVATIR